MPEKPKPEEERDGKRDKSSWSEDQKERGYYYDDAHGYEVYREDEADPHESDERDSEPARSNGE